MGIRLPYLPQLMRLPRALPWLTSIHLLSGCSLICAFLLLNNPFAMWIRFESALAIPGELISSKAEAVSKRLSDQIEARDSQCELSVLTFPKPKKAPAQSAAALARSDTAAPARSPAAPARSETAAPARSPAAPAQVGGASARPPEQLREDDFHEAFLLQNYMAVREEVKERITQQQLLFGLKFTIVGAILAMLVQWYRRDEIVRLAHRSSAALLFCAALLASAVVDVRLRFNSKLIESLGSFCWCWEKTIMETFPAVRDHVAVPWEHYLILEIGRGVFPLLRYFSLSLTVILFGLSLALFVVLPTWAPSKPTLTLLRISAFAMFLIFGLIGTSYYEAVPSLDGATDVYAIVEQDQLPGLGLVVALLLVACGFWSFMEATRRKAKTPGVLDVVTFLLAEDVVAGQSEECRDRLRRYQALLQRQRDPLQFVFDRKLFGPGGDDSSPANGDGADSGEGAGQSLRVVNRSGQIAALLEYSGMLKTDAAKAAGWLARETTIDPSRMEAKDKIIPTLKRSMFDAEAAEEYIWRCYYNYMRGVATLDAAPDSQRSNSLLSRVAG